MGELQSASVTLAEIIAYIKQTEQTGCLHVRLPAPAADAGSPATLVFAQGRLLDARQDDESGDDLVYRLLGNRTATYAFDRLSADALPATRSISRLQELLVLATIGVLAEEDAAPPSAQQTQAFTAALDAPDAPAATRAPAAPALPPTLRPPRPFRRRNMIPLPPGDLLEIDVPVGGGLIPILDRLERDEVSGYVTWFSDTAEGLLLLYLGQVIDAHWAEVHTPTTLADGHAVRHFAAAALAERDADRAVAVYRLDPDFVWSYSALAYSAPRSSMQGMDHVRLPALLARLTAEGQTGCVKVVAGNQAAYLFLGGGRPLGEFRALPDGLESAPGRAMTLVNQPGSLVDLYSAPSPAELLALNAAAWPVERVADELRRTAVAVLGVKAGQVLTLINGAGSDPRALTAACERAKKATRVFIGPDKHAELSRRMDRLLAHLQ
ncbi:MAG: DUF4388 domain-containing protein [Chloroflexota bacterium]|nr:DUF4388 domain-containing protein [Chloroflexota bacterium]